MRRVALTAWPAVASLAVLAVLPAQRIQLIDSAHPGWTVVADSQETSAQNGAAANVIDGDPSTFWRSQYSGGERPFPHTLTLDTGSVGTMAGVVLTPRQDGSADGRMGTVKVQTSATGTAWANVASAFLADTGSTKTVQFPPVSARYLRLSAYTEAGGRGTMSSLAELDLVTTAPAPPAPGTGRWSLPINVPLVPVAGAALSTGKVLLWASYKADTYASPGQEPPGTASTRTMTYDPATGAISQAIAAVDHDMFCPGTALLPDGELLVNGGSSDTKTSVYDPRTGVWTASTPMIIRRGYESAVTTSTGAVFTLGGSWDNPGNDPEGTADNPNRDGELWTAAGGSQLLPGASVAPILTNDTGGIFRRDNHPWLFAWSGGKVLQAGPSKQMHWYSTTGGGSVTDAGPRADDGDAMNGSAVMYDVGKVLAAGGAPSYTDSIATAHAYTIDLHGSSAPVVKAVGPMAHTRAFATGVVLPDGTVLEVGGQNFAHPFSDATAVLTPELFHPSTGTFTALAPMQVPRNYHSIALLLPDARVLTGGGGLCGAGPDCTSNHSDIEVFTPPYLLSSTGALLSRPVITSAPKTALAGERISVRTAKPVTAFSLVRMASVTHSINNDQRRIPLRFTAKATTYDLALPTDPGVLVPGEYMLFALDARGVPSVAKVVQLG